MACVRAARSHVQGGRFPGSKSTQWKALPGNPRDKHTLGDVIVSAETLTAVRSSAPKTRAMEGHKTENPRRVFISGRERGVFGVIKHELCRRSGIEPVIGHMRTEGHFDRCCFKRRHGDAANILRTGHDLRLVLAWLRLLSRLILNALSHLLAAPAAIKWAS